jgi:hypothetical protein
MLLNTKEGTIVTGPLVNLPVASIGAANARVVFTIPILAGQLIGAKSAKIRKVNLYNNIAGNTQIVIGIGVPCVALLPALNSMNGLFDTYGPDDLIEVEAFANITAYPVALAAGTSVDIQLELLICG